MLADGAYDWFEEHGGLTRANGDRFRQMVLSRGNTEDLAKMYADWRLVPQRRRDEEGSRLGAAEEVGACVQATRFVRKSKEKPASAGFSCSRHRLLGHYLPRTDIETGNSESRL
jgi:hypothetical protein